MAEPPAEQAAACAPGPAILVDADACPVKDEVLRVAARHRLRVYLVSNGGLRPSQNPLVKPVVVPEGPDAADDWIVAHLGAGDIAVTADIRLAARCLEKGGYALGPTGKAFEARNIGMALALRDLKAELRETGAIRGGGPAFTRQDRSRFLSALENTVRRAATGLGATPASRL